MPLDVTKLQDGLASLGLHDTEPTAIEELAKAYYEYAKAAMAGTVLLNEPAAHKGKTDMIGVMTGISSDSQGAPKLTLGITTFWTTIAGKLSEAFTGATAITPPPLSGLQLALTGTFATNTSEEYDTDKAAASIALVIHTATITGGTVTFPGPPPITVPIL